MFRLQSSLILAGSSSNLLHLASTCNHRFLPRHIGRENAHRLPAGPYVQGAEIPMVYVN